MPNYKKLLINTLRKLVPIKTQNNTHKYSHYFLKKNMLFITITGILMIMSSCIIMERIIEEYDIVDSSHSYRMTLYNYPVERALNIESIEKTIIKRIDSNNIKTIEVYEIITQSIKGFYVKNIAYIIINDQAFKLHLDEFQEENFLTRSEEIIKTQAIDSALVNVVTNYNYLDKRITRLNYSLDEDMIERIKKSTTIQFRYYLGPEKATIKLRKKQIKNLKLLLSK